MKYTDEVTADTNVNTTVSRLETVLLFAHGRDLCYNIFWGTLYMNTYTRFK